LGRAAQDIDRDRDQALARLVARWSLVLDAETHAAPLPVGLRLVEADPSNGPLRDEPDVLPVVDLDREGVRSWLPVVTLDERAHCGQGGPPQARLVVGIALVVVERGPDLEVARLAEPVLVEREADGRRGPAVNLDLEWLAMLE
jgi:hypothetical protein